MKIDTSKLKYYKTLCEQGVISAQQDDLDVIMSLLEEKQFEYLKRLETTNDESRKDEINEILNVIELQIKEISSLSAALRAGILIDSKAETIPTDYKRNDLLIAEDNKENKKSKMGLIIAAVVIVAVVMSAAIFLLDKSTSDNTVSKDQGVTSEADSNNSEETKLGVQWVQDIGPEFFSGLYITNVRNQTLIDGGMQPGDRLVTVNGENVKTDEECHAVISKYNPGDEAVVVIDRDSNQKTINGVFIKASEQLPEKTSGEVTFTLNGKQVRITFLGNSQLEIDYQ